MESFKLPNFPLMADIVRWLLSIYDPETSLPAEINTEEDRVAFVKAVVGLMVQKTQVKLNPKKLYSSDAYAVQEMLKIANVIYAASSHLENDDLSDVGSLSYDNGRQLSVLKTCKQISMDIMKRAPVLYDLLEREPDLRESRNLMISRNIEMSYIEMNIQDHLKKITDESNTIAQTADSLKTNEANLATKLEKKRQELERRNKRLKSLQGVRPAFLDEFEKLEIELQRIYADYVEKFRNLAYLEHHMKQLVDRETEMMKEKETAMKKWISQLHQEELSILRDDVSSVSSSRDDTRHFLDVVAADLDKPSHDQFVNLTNATATISKGGPVKPLYGSMNAGDSEDDLLDEKVAIRPNAVNVRQQMIEVDDDDELSSNIYDF